MASSSPVTSSDTAVSRRILCSVILSAPSELLIPVLAEKMTDAQLEQLEKATKGRRDVIAQKRAAKKKMKAAQRAKLKAKKKAAREAAKAVAKESPPLPPVPKKEQPEQAVKPVAMASFDSLPDEVALKIIRMAASSPNAGNINHNVLVDVLCKASC